MDYSTIKEANEKWGVGTHIITIYRNEGRIPGVVRKGHMWLIPGNAVRPADKQDRENKTNPPTEKRVRP